MTDEEKELRAAWRAMQIAFNAHCDANARLQKARNACMREGMTAQECWRIIDHERAVMDAETRARIESWSKKTKP